jgi:hypothetical protein
MAVTLFVGYFTRMPLKAPMLVWGSAALLGLVSNFITAIRFWQTKYAAARIGTFYFFIGLLTAAAALFAILYVFKAVKKIPAVVISGVLLTALLIMGIVFNLRNLIGFLNANNKNALLITQILLSMLHSLIYPVGIFLTLLSTKEKEVK